MKVAVVSGGFDPLHSGHIRLLEEASEMGDKLVVCLNSDKWLARKKGTPFMSFKERSRILKAIGVVDEVIAFDDSDDSCTEGLKQVQDMYARDDIFNDGSEFYKTKVGTTIIFCNGGDRLSNNIPSEEKDLPGINFVYGVGGYTKENSSSKLLQIVKRQWGAFRVFHHGKKCKVKELIIQPNLSISYQRHFRRSEIWFISEGECIVKHAKTDRHKYTEHELNEDDVFTVRQGEWHQITNRAPYPCHIIEIQYGDKMSELDIERADENI